MPDQVTMALLRTLELFSDLSDEHLGILALAATEKLYAPGRRVFDEGDVSDAFFVIKYGVVRLARRDGVQLAELTNGDIFGEMGALDHSPRTATATAALRSSIMKIPSAALEQVFETRRSVEMKVRRKILERHRANIAATFKRDE